MDGKWFKKKYSKIHSNRLCVFKTVSCYLYNVCYILTEQADAISKVKKMKKPDVQTPADPEPKELSRSQRRRQQRKEKWRKKKENENEAKNND